MKEEILDTAVKVIHQGGLIAYPTEAVFGLGCDPFNKQAVTRLLALKQRSMAKGLILIAGNWEQLIPLVDIPDKDMWSKVRATWPGAVTWLFPVSNQVPDWIKGSYNTVAIRLTAHPIAQALCIRARQVIVSTSANIEAHPPLCSATAVAEMFGDNIDYIVPGAVGDLARPTPIKDVITGKIVRE